LDCLPFNGDDLCVIGTRESHGEFCLFFILHARTYSAGAASGTADDGLEEKIVQLNPLLEAFGNAQTLMNDNSSRFGKFIEIRFNAEAQITGATMKEYLLEKSRIMEQTEGERNFHVWYLLLSGLADRLEEFELGNVDDHELHRMIHGSDEALASIGSAKTMAMWEEFTECFGIVGFTKEEQEGMFKMLIGILHLADVEFGGGAEDSAYVVSSEDQLGKGARQLDVDGTQLNDGMLKMTTTTRGETIERHFKQAEAEDGRDALCKAAYEKLFSWIFQRCNALLGPANRAMTDKTIGILDIFGFETFDVNSFEQLLINLANEQLQYFFNEHIFALELSEYASEGIDGSSITYENNEVLLDMLLGKTGVLKMCDDAAKMPRGDDKGLLEAMHQTLKDKPGYIRPKGNQQTFEIKHYAGQIEYHVDGFLEKNRDTLAMDVVAVLRLSESDLIKSLFGGEVEKAGAKSKRKGRGGKGDLKKSMKRVKQDAAKGNKKTVGDAFKNSLHDLITEMSACQPHFVRCIKPNLEKSPNNFKIELVTRQLRYTGMLETTRIRKEGYSHRPMFQDFIDRYKIIGFPLTSAPPPSSGSCNRILQKAGILNWQVGRTKVFLRYYHPGELGQVMAPYPAAAAQIQNVARAFTERQEVQGLLAEAKKQAKVVADFCLVMERHIEGVHAVSLALCDEDTMRPPDYFEKKKLQSKRIRNPTMKKMQQKADKQKAGITRKQSVKWFQEVEMAKGAGRTDEGDDFEKWFHGIISRVKSEELLMRMDPGAFLVRVSESRFGYSLSHYIARGQRIKHYMIEQTPEGEYMVVGNARLFPSLNDLVAHHKRNKIVATDPVSLTTPCPAEGDSEAAAAMAEIAE
jgi:myosin-3